VQALQFLQEYMIAMIHLLTILSMATKDGQLDYNGKIQGIADSN
jgi:hypothetical protein